MLKHSFFIALAAISGLHAVHADPVTSPNPSNILHERAAADLSSFNSNVEGISMESSVSGTSYPVKDKMAELLKYLTSSGSKSWCGTLVQPSIRKEWRKLTSAEKRKYHDAVICLQKKPAFAKLHYSGVKSRFDDFVAGHINATKGIMPFEAPTGGIHMVGALLPWHRYFVFMYELALKFECGYEGAQPYWDWTLDANNFGASPVFNRETGFGTNGPKENVTGIPSNPVFPGGTGGGCSKTDVYKDYKLQIGPGESFTANPRCLRRNFNPPMAKSYLTYDIGVKPAMDQKTFYAFRLKMDPINAYQEITQHGAGHIAVGGEMADLFSSPGDPLFYLHHGMLDRIWTKWQSQNPSEAGKICGPTVPFLGEGASPETTLDTMLWMGQVAPSLPIKYFMDTLSKNGKGFLCYRYDQ